MLLYVICISGWTSTLESWDLSSVLFGELQSLERKWCNSSLIAWNEDWNFQTSHIFCLWLYLQRENNTLSPKLLQCKMWKLRGIQRNILEPLFKNKVKQQALIGYHQFYSLLYVFGFKWILMIFKLILLFCNSTFVWRKHCAIQHFIFTGYITGSQHRILSRLHVCSFSSKELHSLSHPPHPRQPCGLNTLK